MAAPGTTTSDCSAEVFRALQELHARKDASGIRRLFTEDAVYDDDGWHEPAVGHAGIERFFGAVWRAFPDMRIELTDGPYDLEDGGSFAVRGQLSGTMTGRLDPPGLGPTGAPISVEFAAFYEPDGDRIRRGRVIMDTRALASQLGALPEPGSVTERLAVWIQRLKAWWMRRAVSTRIRAS